MEMMTYLFLGIMASIVNTYLGEKLQSFRQAQCKDNYVKLNC